MRIALFGQAAFGKDVFDALQAAGEEIVGVSTPRPGERPDPLYVAAQDAGLPLIPTRDLRREEHFEPYRAWNPDLLVFAFVTDIVRKNVLDAATYGAIQYHPSLLPRHRGRSAIAWPLIEGETKTGVTIFWVDEGIDTGPILLQREVAIGEQDSVGSLYFEQLYPIGVEMLAEATAMVRDGTAPRLAQDEAQATYEPPLGPEHGAIDWSRPRPAGLQPHPRLRPAARRQRAAEWRAGRRLRRHVRRRRPGRAARHRDRRARRQGRRSRDRRHAHRGEAPGTGSAEGGRRGARLERRRAPARSGEPPGEHRVIVGTVAETKSEEYRVALTPDGVRDIVLAGHTVLVEREAGTGSNYDDDEYREAGAEVLDGPEAVYERADLICEVKEPQPAEFELLREGQLLFTYLHLAAEPAVTDALLRSRCIAIGYETVRRDDGFLPLLAPMSEVAGRMAVELGAQFLRRPGPGRGVLLCGLPGVPPAHVVVIGSGTVGRNAVRAAVGAGARVSVLSINGDQLRALEEQHSGRIETVLSSPQAVAQTVAGADLLIGAVLAEGRRAPVVVTRRDGSLDGPRGGDRRCSGGPGRLRGDDAADQPPGPGLR